MYNRYRGSGGAPERVAEPQTPPKPRPGSPLPPQSGPGRSGQSPPPPPPKAGQHRSPPGKGQPPPQGPRPGGRGGAPPGEQPGKNKAPSDSRRGLEHILARLDPGKLETEDLLVLAILWLLYRDSGDKDLLIAMGAYLFL